METLFHVRRKNNWSAKWAKQFKIKHKKHPSAKATKQNKNQQPQNTKTSQKKKKQTAKNTERSFDEPHIESQLSTTESEIKLQTIQRFKATYSCKVAGSLPLIWLGDEHKSINKEYNRLVLIFSQVIQYQISYCSFSKLKKRCNTSAPDNLRKYLEASIVIPISNRVKQSKAKQHKVK